eukprot:TRINITY_DN3064_c0_g1_i2.p2 TRINITY_DN3064_c0_g1~~TRINITY_DN3064_c0_g1_i2.p2  ORF type:complete len:302 (+),score=107.05 TRINITY_DN3064_c0_g1_i2:166-1071(+)
MVLDQTLKVCPVNKWELYNTRGGKGGLPWQGSFASRQLEAVRYRIYRKEEDALLKPRRTDPTRMQWAAAHQNMAALARGGQYGYALPAAAKDTSNSVFLHTRHLDNTRPERKEKAKVAMPKAHRHVREFLDASASGKYNGKALLPARPSTAPLRRTADLAATTGTEGSMNSTLGCDGGAGQIGAGWRYIRPVTPADYRSPPLTDADVEKYIPPHVRDPPAPKAKKPARVYGSPIFEGMAVREADKTALVKRPTRSWQEVTRDLSVMQFSSFQKKAHPTPYINPPDMPSAGVPLTFPEREGA